MKLKYTKLKVKGIFTELFGREIPLHDIVLILLGALAVTIAIELVCIDIELMLYQNILLVILALDLGGGVVANFTEGTNNYYFESAERRYIFIVMHVLQPLLLSWIFAYNPFVIVFLTGYTLTCSFIITSITSPSVQKSLAATMLVVAVVLTFVTGITPLALQILLLIYALKLIFAFSVNWTHQSE